ncbi:MAG: hypothetical protein EBR30_17465 [Cytophagia bacterium]|nr:hypothetical protein [Cytophagia bacterium]
MQIHQLKKNEITPAAFEWLQEKYKAVDAMNAEAYGKFLADDCQLMFANHQISKGRIPILEGIQQFWNAIAGLNHSFLTILGSDHYMAAEALIDYKRKDGKVVALPCVTMIERNAAGEATSVRIFIDTAPIFQTEIK